RVWKTASTTTGRTAPTTNRPRPGPRSDRSQRACGGRANAGHHPSFGGSVWEWDRVWVELDNSDHEVMANHVGPEVIRLQPRESVPGTVRALQLVPNTPVPSRNRITR